MKVALVGAGYWGAKLLRNLVSAVGTERVVVVDRAMERLRAVQFEYPTVETSTDFDEVLGDDHVGAVVVATPAASHARLVGDSLSAGCHTFVEKPLATNSEEAARLASLAAEKDLRLMVGHTFLFSPRVEWMVQHLHRPGGTPVRYLTSSRLNLGQHRHDANVIWDLGPHDISIALTLLGELPESVSTTARSVVTPGLPDVAFINLSFPSGAVASVTVSWLAPRKVRNLVAVTDTDMIVYDDTEADEPVKVYNRGIEAVDSSNFGEHQLTYRYGDTVAPHIPVHEPLRIQMDHFVAAVSEPQITLRSDGRFGTQVVAVLEAADRSWREGSASVPLDTAAIEIGP